MKKLFIAFILIILTSANAVAEVRKQTFSNGYYIGEVNSKNERHGYGIYYFNSGQRYEGSWRNNDYNGYGVFKIDDGDILKGYFSDHELSNGSYHWNQYEFRGDKFYGKFTSTYWIGRYIYANGDSKYSRKNLLNRKWTTIENNYSLYSQAKSNSDKADEATRTARRIVNQYKNKTSKKWQLRYCKKSNGIIYSLNGYGCKTNEKEVSRYEYENYLETIKFDSYEINKWYYSHALNLRVRSKPNTNSNILGYLGKGDMIYVTGKIISQPWLIVQFKNKTGYVSSDYVKSYKPDKPENTTKKTTTKTKKSDKSYNPAVIVLIGVGIFIFYVIFIKKKDGSSPSWKKYTTESLSRFKPASTKRTTYVSKSSKTATSSRSNKTPFEAKKSRTVGGKATKRIDPIIIKKTKKAIKKGIICKYCDTENRRTAVTCISCNKSLS